MIQGRWFDDHPLLCLPHITPELLPRFGKAMTIPQFQSDLKIDQISSKPTEHQRKSIEKHLKIKFPLTNHEANQLTEGLLSWPIVQLNDLQFQQHLRQCEIDPFNVFEEQQEFIIPLQQGQIYRLKVSVGIVGPAKVRLNMLRLNRVRIGPDFFVSRTKKLPSPKNTVRTNLPVWF